ncbi:MAG: heme biosynthesis HemY N-terminal domain-containing protein [Steroidobacteraceae bacterium]
MRGAVIVALALVGGGLVAQLLLTDPGYVAVRAGRSLVETTLPVLLAFLAAAYLVVRGIAGIVSARRRLAELHAERRRRRARDDTRRGLLDLAAGNWRRAEELLTRSAADADSPASNYLIAARAADLLDAIDRRDQWLAQAQESAPEERAAALVTLAEMQLRRGQDAAAVRTLEQLEASGDLNSRGLELLARLYPKLGQGEKLLQLGPRLMAAKELPPAQVSELLAQVQLEEIRAAGAHNDQARLEKAWSDLSRGVRRLPQSIVTYARAAMACNDHPTAEKLLRELIDDTSDPAAVRLYGDLVLADPLAPLDRAEGWLRKRPEDPELLATCARLCLRAELVGKARSYLEASLARRPSSENSLILADLLDQIGERERAADCLRKAVTLSVGRRPNVPRVRLRRR